MNEFGNYGSIEDRYDDLSDEFQVSSNQSENSSSSEIITLDGYIRRERYQDDLLAVDYHESIHNTEDNSQRDCERLAIENDSDNDALSNRVGISEWINSVGGNMSIASLGQEAHIQSLVYDEVYANTEEDVGERGKELELAQDFDIVNDEKSDHELELE